MREVKFLLMSLIIFFLSLEIVAGDTISINSGGSYNTVILSHPDIYGFFFENVTGAIVVVPPGGGGNTWPSWNDTNYTIGNETNITILENVTIISPPPTIIYPNLGIFGDILSFVIKYKFYFIFLFFIIINFLVVIIFLVKLRKQRFELR